MPRLSVPVEAQFGHLTVLGPAPQVEKQGGRSYSAWECICECGTRRVFRASRVNSGKVRSCGCVPHRPRLVHGGAVHGKLHPLYGTWHGMRQRCNNPKHTAYHYYGGRGIEVCERWDDFAAFLEDVGERPEGTTLDRIDNDGNYEPGNVRWATALEQRHNRRDSR